MLGAKLTILGCGGSLGVPLWGNQWGKCDPNNPKNRRFRTSAMVDYQGKRFLIDTGPDLRQQALDFNVDAIDAVLYTHTHSDHISGIDELRALHWFMQRNIDVYGSQETLNDIKARFPYLVPGGDSELYKSFLNFQKIQPGAQTIQDCEIVAIPQDHITCQPFGYRFNNIAYTTDVKHFSDKALDMLKGIEHWIISCPFLLRHGHPTHADYDQVLQWINYIKPRKAYLTHLSQNVDYGDAVKSCPDNIQLCYDGLVIE